MKMSPSMKERKGESPTDNQPTKHGPTDLWAEHLLTTPHVSMQRDFPQGTLLPPSLHPHWLLLFFGRRNWTSPSGCSPGDVLPAERVPPHMFSAVLSQLNGPDSMQLLQCLVGKFDLGFRIQRFTIATYYSLTLSHVFQPTIEQFQSYRVDLHIPDLHLPLNGFQTMAVKRDAFIGSTKIPTRLTEPPTERVKTKRPRNTKSKTPFTHFLHACGSTSRQRINTGLRRNKGLTWHSARFLCCQKQWEGLPRAQPPSR